MYIVIVTFIFTRFVLTVPMATSPPISFHVSHPDPSDFIRDCNQKEILNNFVTSNNQIIHSADTAMCLQFPETRLIQYDCGMYMYMYMYNHNHPLTVHVHVVSSLLYFCDLLLFSCHR